MGKKGFFAALGLLTAVTLCLLLVMVQRYPATLSQLLTGRLGTAPSAVTVTSWPNNRQTTFTIDDPTCLAQLWALIEDVPLTAQDKAPCFYPSKGCYRFSLDGGREVLTDGIYLYTKDRTYTAQTLPALLSVLYRADEKALTYAVGETVLPHSDDPLQWNWDFRTQMEAFGLDAPGKFYALAQQSDGLWRCYTASYHVPVQDLLRACGITLPSQLGTYRLTGVHNLALYLDYTLWQNDGVMLLEGDFEAGRIYDWTDKLTLHSFSADYVGPAENPEHHKPNCPGLYVSVNTLLLQDHPDTPPNGYTEEPPFDGGDLCPELAGWQVEKCYSYAMGGQFEKGWLFIAPNGWLSAQFTSLIEVSAPASINWHSQALHRDMTREQLTQEGQWLLPLLDVADAMN